LGFEAQELNLSLQTKEGVLPVGEKLEESDEWAV
jgi:hypothetical protein